MIKRIMQVAMAALVLGFAAPAAQADGPVVVELFTSQGCSSCPPADAMFVELAERDDLIALALHVDYWDYLGWKDTMGNAAHTKRQKAYAYAAGSHTIYTPQIIVGGVTHVIGHRPQKVEQAIAGQRALADLVDLQIRRSGQKVTIRAVGASDLPRNMSVLLVRFIPNYNVAIKRGENAGRTITYANAVTDMQEVARWDGRSALNLTATARGSEPVAVLIQAPGPGQIFAAAVAN